MLEFSTFCVLQPHKTGSTFIERFLRENVNETVQRYDKHAFPAFINPNLLYISTIRNPLDLYLSQFSYGLDGRSGLRRTIEKTTTRRLYSEGVKGFDSWLRYLHSPSILMALPDYTPRFENEGFATWRIMRILTFGFKTSEIELDILLRFESLCKDLAGLSKGLLLSSLKDLPTALAWLEETPALNTSSRPDRNVEVTISLEVLEIILKRDAKLFAYYPDTKLRCFQALETSSTEMISVSKLIEI